MIILKAPGITSVWVSYLLKIGIKKHTHFRQAKLQYRFYIINV